MHKIVRDRCFDSSYYFNCMSFVSNCFQMNEFENLSFYCFKGLKFWGFAGCLRRSEAVAAVLLILCQYFLFYHCFSFSFEQSYQLSWVCVSTLQECFTCLSQGLLRLLGLLQAGAAASLNHFLCPFLGLHSAFVAYEVSYLLYSSEIKLELSSGQPM